MAGLQELRSNVPGPWGLVLLRWALDRGCAVIPKSVRAERVAQASPAELLGWRLPSDVSGVESKWRSWLLR